MAVSQTTTITTRRALLTGAAAVLAIAPTIATTRALASAAPLGNLQDEPLFALLDRHLQLEQEYDRTDAAREAAEKGLESHDAAVNEAGLVHQARVGKITDQIYSDEARMHALTTNTRAESEATGRNTFDSGIALIGAIKRLAEDDPRAHATGAALADARAKRDAFHVAHVVPAASACTAAHQAFTTAEHAIVAYPVTSLAGMRAKLDAIHMRGLAPEWGCGVPADLPSFAAMVLDDLARIGPELGGAWPLLPVGLA